MTEVWFKRTGVVENQPPAISVSDNQTVHPAQTAYLRATVIDPNQDPTTVTWSQLATSTCKRRKMSMMAEKSEGSSGTGTGKGAGAGKGKKSLTRISQRQEKAVSSM